MITVLQSGPCDAGMNRSLFKFAQSIGFTDYLAKAFEQDDETVFKLSIYILVLFSSNSAPEIATELDRVDIYNKAIQSLLKLNPAKEGDSHILGRLTHLLAHLANSSPAKAEDLVANKLSLIIPCLSSFLRELEAASGIIYLLFTCMKLNRIGTREHITSHILEMVQATLAETENYMVRWDCIEIFQQISVVTSQEDDSQFEGLFKYLVDSGLYRLLIKSLEKPDMNRDESLSCLKCFTNIFSANLNPEVERVTQSFISEALRDSRAAVGPAETLHLFQPIPRHPIRILPHPDQPARL